MYSELDSGSRIGEIGDAAGAGTHPARDNEAIARRVRIGERQGFAIDNDLQVENTDGKPALSL
jgi:hypothetical protein